MIVNYIHSTSRVSQSSLVATFGRLTSTTLNKKPACYSASKPLADSSSAWDKGINWLDVGNSFKHFFVDFVNKAFGFGL